MKLQFKEQQFQLDAVSAIADIFQGQNKQTGIRYMADPGRQKSDEVDLVLMPIEMLRFNWTRKLFEAMFMPYKLVWDYDLLKSFRSIW